MKISKFTGYITSDLEACDMKTIEPTESQVCGKSGKALIGVWAHKQEMINH